MSDPLVDRCRALLEATSRRPGVKRGEEDRIVPICRADVGEQIERPSTAEFASAAGWLTFPRAATAFDRALHPLNYLDL